MKKKNIDFNNAIVLVVGDLILDCYWYSKNYYMLSEQSIPVASIKKIKNQPGGAGNVAKNIAEIGGKCKIISIIGDDNEGEILKKLLKHEKISSDLINIKNTKTITKIRIISNKKQLMRLDFEEKYSLNNFNLLYKKIINSLKSYKILVLSDYAKGTLCHIKKIIRLANEMSIITLIDPKGIDFEKYSGATLLTPNLSEFEKIVGQCHEEKEILKKGIQLISQLNLSALLVTRSKNGMTLFQNKKKPIHFPAISKIASDVTGAGDTVISIIAAALSNGYSLEESCFYANIGASIVIKKIGTETLNINELNTILNI
ncbi:D-glycero-beta-D-manno-heptose-7-phosphate kinase [Buchnera aphidicola]|uniref:D-glycero-beta-D-manno-heptose-7-phosphate kinase n=1 Tax=Buchnera aphidicola (Aphis nerii) TaxID=1241835 RepID=A0A4D6XTU5_9GAMM|nr:D-glycero-beta-D-manno-heptose-7-phosphate kinase [Buchnera aphidicola]QCI18627.1 D-glycero-beta-D-manno-heptose-7-phosphate kinase [Buchnera aphidicola (Aphis nerii)]